jgi:hypothetical protein
MRKFFYLLLVLLTVVAPAQSPTSVGRFTASSPPPIVTPIVRGTSSATANSNSLTLTLPTGTISGDLAVFNYSSAFNPAGCPSGWAQLSILTSTAWDQLTCSKVLASGDITAGSVTVSAANTFNETGIIVIFQGATGGIRETDFNTADNIMSFGTFPFPPQNASYTWNGLTPTLSLCTGGSTQCSGPIAISSSAPQVGDILLSFGSVRSGSWTNGAMPCFITGGGNSSVAPGSVLSFVVGGASTISEAVYGMTVTSAGVFSNYCLNQTSRLTDVFVAHT